MRAVFGYNLACDIDDCDIYSVNFISQKFIFGIFTQIFVHLLIVKTRIKVYSVVVF